MILQIVNQKADQVRRWAIIWGAVSLSLLLVGCGARPTGRPDFSVISSPQRPAPAQLNPTPVPPTKTPLPPPSPTSLPAEPSEPDKPTLFEVSPAQVIPTPAPPTDTPIPEEAPPTNTPPTEPTETSTATAVPPTPRPQSPPDEPRVGGSWDMEDGFEFWINPYGDDCSGSKVAIGWQGFTSRGQYGSSCFVQNEYAPNVFSGRYSQEVTFDFVDSHAGLYRTFDSQIGHTYQVTAHLRFVHTVPEMHFHFGYDLTGGTNWEAETVQWTPWAEFKVDEWTTHVQVFEASGPQTTIFIKGFHEAATQGGATYVDAVEVIDLGVQ